MALFDLTALPQLDRLNETAAGIRCALERIATCLEKSLAIPELAIPEKPIGPEAVGTYGQTIMDLEGDDAEAIRKRLRASGLSDSNIEDELVKFLTGEESQEL